MKASYANMEVKLLAILFHISNVSCSNLCTERDYSYQGSFINFIRSSRIIMELYHEIDQDRIF
jgi:hypothetical protein